MKQWLVAALGGAFFLAAVSSLQAQAVYTAERSSRLEAGAGAMYLNNDYSTRKVGGVAVWVDYDFTKLIGAEAEGRFSIFTPDDISENSYIIGPTFAYRKRKFKVYAKLLVGRATITNQINNNSSSYNMYEFGGGVTYRVTRKLSARGDVGVQQWPNFAPHTLSPFAVTIGVMYAIR